MKTSIILVMTTATWTFEPRMFQASAFASAAHLLFGAASAAHLLFGAVLGF